MAYNTEQRAGESLERYYRRLAKVADQRLVRLEAYQHRDHFKTATRWAYQNAINDIERYSGKGAIRFNTNPPADADRMREKINDMIRFIQAPTSTKQGIVNVYKKRADTLNKNWGTNFTWEDMAAYFESGQAKKWDEALGYQTSLKTIAVLQKNKKKILDGIEKAKEQNKKVPVDKEGNPIHINAPLNAEGEKDEVLQLAIDQALADQNLDLTMLF